MIEWGLNVWGEEGIVDDNKDAVLVGNSGYIADVNETEGGVGR